MGSGVFNSFRFAAGLRLPTTFAHHYADEVRQVYAVIEKRLKCKRSLCWKRESASDTFPLQRRLKTPDSFLLKRKKTRRPLVVRPRVEGGTVARAARCKGRREVLSLAAGFVFPRPSNSTATDGIGGAGGRPSPIGLRCLLAGEHDHAKPWCPLAATPLSIRGAARVGSFGATVFVNVDEFPKS
jgi:hypothetical protein